MFADCIAPKRMGKNKFFRQTMGHHGISLIKELDRLVLLIIVRPCACARARVCVAVDVAVAVAVRASLSSSRARALSLFLSLSLSLSLSVCLCVWLWLLLLLWVFVFVCVCVSLPLTSARSAHRCDILSKEGSKVVHGIVNAGMGPDDGYATPTGSYILCLTYWV